MQIWKTYKDFSAEFLTKHHNVVLYDTFHQLLAMLLYPLDCKCTGDCSCDELRKMIILSLNVDLFERIQQEQEDDLYRLKLFLQIPEDHYFRQRWSHAFPLRLIRQQLKQKEPAFKRVDHLVWGLLRLARTYRACGGCNQASVKETLRLILGQYPLKGKKVHHLEQLGGEKAYIQDLKTYKSICHLIAAFELWTETTSPPASNNSFLCKTPERIERLLTCLHWVRCELLALETRNVKGGSLFSEAILLPLPNWIDSNPSDISLRPFNTKVKKSKERDNKVVLVVGNL